VKFWVVLRYESSDSEAVAAEVLLLLELLTRKNVEGEKRREKPCSSHKERELVLDCRISQYQARGPR